MLSDVHAYFCNAITAFITYHDNMFVAKRFFGMSFNDFYCKTRKEI